METTTIEITEDQADRLHDLKERGDSYKDVIARLLEAVDEGEGERPRADHAADQREQAPSVSAVDVEEPPDSLEAVDFPSQLDRRECAETVLAAREFLDQHGPASMREIVVAVMPEHSLSYEVPEIEGDELVPDRFRGAWWRKVVRPGLRALPDVQKPGTGQSDWRFSE